MSFTKQNLFKFITDKVLTADMGGYWSMIPPCEVVITLIDEQIKGSQGSK